MLHIITSKKSKDIWRKNFPAHVRVTWLQRLPCRWSPGLPCAWAGSPHPSLHPWSHASCPAVAEATFPERQTWSHPSLGANRLALEEQLLKFPNASFITKWRNAAKCPKVITFGLVPPSLFQSPCADRAPPSWVADHTLSGEKKLTKVSKTKQSI